METLKSRYLQLYQDKFFLEPDIPELEAYLKEQHWLRSDDHLKVVEKPGEGNMNLVLRVVPDQAPSFILKQARPWVEKYPQLDAPVERIEVEHIFYQQVLAHPQLTTFSPIIIGFDKENSLLAMEDLGQTTDFSYVYQRHSFFNSSDLEIIINYINNLQQLPVPANYPANDTLRALNHQHIFHLPFITDNQFDLDQVQPGLEKLSEPCKTDQDLFQQVEVLGQSYLGSGPTLLHGDFYPCSLLKANNGLKVIDPEFSFAGPVEWDISVFIAHLFLSATPIELIRLAFNQYQKTTDFNYQLFSGFVGVEILRRLVGLAQLSLEMGLEQKTQLIAKSIEWVKQENIDILPR